MIRRYHRNAAEGPDPIHSGKGSWTTYGSPSTRNKRKGKYRKAVLVNYPDSRTTQQRNT